MSPNCVVNRFLYKLTDLFISDEYTLLRRHVHARNYNHYNAMVTETQASNS